MTTKKRNRLSIGVIALGAILSLAGIYRGEINTMFEKAINICLECIGIG